MNGEVRNWKDSEKSEFSGLGRCHLKGGRSVIQQNRIEEDKGEEIQGSKFIVRRSVFLESCFFEAPVHFCRH